MSNQERENQQERRQSNENLLVISQEVVEKAILEDTGGGENLRNFTRSTCRLMERDNQILLDFILRGGLGVSGLYGEEAGIAFLQGSTFIYGCFNYETEKRQKPMLKISEETIKEVAGKAAQIEEEYGKAKNKKARRRAKEKMEKRELAILEQIKRENPALYEGASALLMGAKMGNISREAFVQLLDGIISTYEFFQRQTKKAETVKEEAERKEEQTKPSLLPIVSEATTREAFVEIILDKRNFITPTIEKLEKENPVMAKRIAKTAAFNPYGEEYLLFSSFVCYCLLEEFRKANLEIPKVSEDTIKSLAAKELQEIERDEKVAGRKLVVLERMILDQIRDENPHLNRALSILTQARIPPNSPKFVAALNGMVHPYHTFHGQMEVDSLERKFKL